MALLFCQKALSISFIVCPKKNLSAVHLNETCFIDSTLVVGGLLSECELVTSSSIGMMVNQAGDNILKANPQQQTSSKKK